MAIAAGAITSNGKLGRIYACDLSTQAEIGNATKGILYLPLAASPNDIHVCSYAIMNGSVAQDVTLWTVSGPALDSNNVPICMPGSKFQTYHLGPFETISRGSGIGVLFTAPTNGAFCLSKSTQNALSAEFTYAR